MAQPPPIISRLLDQSLCTFQTRSNNRPVLRDPRVRSEPGRAAGCFLADAIRTPGMNSRQRLFTPPGVRTRVLIAAMVGRCYLHPGCTQPSILFTPHCATRVLTVHGAIYNPCVIKYFICVGFFHASRVHLHQKGLFLFSCVMGSPSRPANNTHLSFR